MSNGFNPEFGAMGETPPCAHNAMGDTRIEYADGLRITWCHSCGAETSRTPHSPFTVGGIPVRVIDTWFDHPTLTNRAIVEWLADDTAHGIAQGSTMGINAREVKGL
jgi:hypothetical protein